MYCLSKTHWTLIFDVHGDVDTHISHHDNTLNTGFTLDSNIASNPDHTSNPNYVQDFISNYKCVFN